MICYIYVFMCKSFISLNTIPYLQLLAGMHGSNSFPLQGCDERHDKFPPKPEWVDRNILDYGYTKIQPLNSIHLYLEQISDDRVRLNPVIGIITL